MGVNFFQTQKTVLERLIDVFNDLNHTSVSKILILRKTAGGLCNLGDLRQQ